MRLGWEGAWVRPSDEEDEELTLEVHMSSGTSLPTLPLRRIRSGGAEAASISLAQFFHPSKPVPSNKLPLADFVDFVEEVVVLGRGGGGGYE